ncbi:hypothetical protein SETIT_3G018700v2 [Setaria italica]|uniref:Embryo surrounding factor 1 brassicaceae domain-containing protein n=2 Tax=Setaria italica TaxID=4555 RepID=A0A368QA90_SETIT|nr:hypothetical protein SETIT_3G018700v2 [Setaria italica]
MKGRGALIGGNKGPDPLIQFLQTQVSGMSDGLLNVRTMALFIVFSGCLSPPGRCRPVIQEARDTFSSDVSSVRSTSLDGSKIYVVFCIWGHCDCFGHGLQDCYCCGSFERHESCHQTMEECRAQCLVCNPNCSPRSPLRSTHEIADESLYG